MKYDISKPSAPKMPALGRGTECIRLLLSQVSEDNHEPLSLHPAMGTAAGNGLQGHQQDVYAATVIACRLSEPTEPTPAHSREPHVQTPEARKIKNLTI